jgi:GTP-binding protein HflX
MIEKKKLVFEKTVLIGVITARQDEDQALEYLAELAFLAHTAGGEVIKQFTQKVTLPNPKTFIGSGSIIRIHCE